MAFMADLGEDTEELAFGVVDLSQLEVVAATYGERHYNFCLRLCLGDRHLAEGLYKKVMKKILSTTKVSDQFDDLFYQTLHKIWPSYCRFRSRLKGESLRIDFDWGMGGSSSHLLALKKLNPLERELFLHRFLNRFKLNRIRRVLNMSASEVSLLFHQALTKVVN